MTFNKDEVYLIDFGFLDIVKVRIVDCIKDTVCYSYDGFKMWEPLDEFHKRNPRYLGRVRRILGIPFGIIR